MRRATTIDGLGRAAGGIRLDSQSVRLLGAAHCQDDEIRVEIRMRAPVTATISQVAPNTNWGPSKVPRKIHAACALTSLHPSVPAAEEKTEEAEAVVSVEKVEPSDDQLLYVFLACPSIFRAD